MRWNLALGGLAASWGFIAVLAASVELGAEALAFWRLALAALTLGLTVAIAGRGAQLRPRGRLPALAALGCVQAAHWLLFFKAVELGSVALAVLTFYAAPLLIAIAAPLLLPERVSWIAVGACLVGALGVVLISIDGTDGRVSVEAVSAGLGSAATYALLVILAKRLLETSVEPVTVTFWDCLVGTLVLVPVVLVAAPRLLPTDGEEWGVVVALGVLFTALSTLLYAVLLRRVTAQAAGVLTFLEPVAGVLLAWALLAEEPGGPTLAGGLLVLLAGLVVVVHLPSGVGVTEAPAGVGSAPE